VIAPGRIIGILGGGQLGRMTAIAARSMGYGVHTLDPDPTCPARGVADRTITAPFDDELAAAWLAHGCDVVTLEIEKIALGSLRAAAERAPLRPGADILEIVQDRGRQRAWLAKHGLPQGPWTVAEDDSALRAAAATHGHDAFAKARFGGYDGRGQVRIVDPATAAGAFAVLGPAVVEAALPLEAELSVMVARRPSGEVVVFPPALNHHEQRILAWSAIPAPLPAAVLARAEEMGREIARAIALEGVLAIELFLLADGVLLVNELAPRPHNSFHATERACATSQFEQHVRAICDLPLGSTAIREPTAIANLLGDLWSAGEPDFAAVLAIPGVKLHLYGKTDARPGRKMGHLSAVASTPGGAAELALHAAGLLERRS
jgi:5-(carboxyamino)imidazole ribonucleotide synthase